MFVFFSTLRPCTETLKYIVQYIKLNAHQGQWLHNYMVQFFTFLLSLTLAFDSILTVHKSENCRIGGFSIFSSCCSLQIFEAFDKYNRFIKWCWLCVCVCRWLWIEMECSTLGANGWLIVISGNKHVHSYTLWI